MDDPLASGEQEQEERALQPRPTTWWPAITGEKSMTVIRVTCISSVATPLTVNRSLLELKDDVVNDPICLKNHQMVACSNNRVTWKEGMFNGKLELFINFCPTEEIV